MSSIICFDHATEDFQVITSCLICGVHSLPPLAETGSRMSRSREHAALSGVFAGVPPESSGRRSCWQLCLADAVTQNPTPSPEKSTRAVATCPTSTSSASSCSALTWWGANREGLRIFLFAPPPLLWYRWKQPPDSTVIVGTFYSDLCFTGCRVKWDKSRKVKKKKKKLTLSSAIPSASENSTHPWIWLIQTAKPWFKGPGNILAASLSHLQRYFKTLNRLNEGNLKVGGCVGLIQIIENEKLKLTVFFTHWKSLFVLFNSRM